MSPFAGKGVNVAMMDAVLLGRALKKVRVSGGLAGLQAAVEGFETKVKAIVQEKAEESERNIAPMFAEEGPQAFVDMMKQLMPGGGPPPEEGLGQPL